MLQPSRAGGADSDERQPAIRCRASGTGCDHGKCGDCQTDIHVDEKIFNIHAELLVRKKMRLKKNNVYIVRIPNRANDILQELRIMDKSLSFVRGISQDIVKKSCRRAAYLRGAFLAGGSVNHPEASSYHLEIFTSYQDFCEALTKMANRYKLNAKCIERKKATSSTSKKGRRSRSFSA